MKSGGQALIIGGMSIAILDTTIQDLKTHSNRGPAIKVILGGFIVTVTLLIVSDSQPELAESLALLILLATLFGPNGTALTDLVTKVTSGKVTTQTVAANTATGTHVIQS